MAGSAVRAWVVLAALGCVIASAAACSAPERDFDETGGGGAGAAGGAGGAGGTGGGGVPCDPGQQQVCYSGPPETLNVGICQAGVQTCNMDGVGFGPCEGEVLPQQEIPGDGVDDDCNGSDVTQCDGTDCQSCVDCAIIGACAELNDQCASDMSCNAFIDCVSMCSVDDPACIDACASAYPDGAAIYGALVDCVLCQECPNICPMEMVYDPFPGC